jgi:Methyltransferase domain
LIRRLAAAVSLRSRRRKLRLFLEEMSPTAETSVVDVGVADAPFGEGEGQAATYNFLEALYPWPERITAVSVDDLPHFRDAFPGIRTVQADGRDLPFADREFDIAFSNAVVEHLGDRASQEAFVRELCRVARSSTGSRQEPASACCAGPTCTCARSLPVSSARSSPTRCGSSPAA